MNLEPVHNAKTSAKFTLWRVSVSCHVFRAKSPGRMSPLHRITHPRNLDGSSRPLQGAPSGFNQTARGDAGSASFPGSSGPGAMSFPTKRKHQQPNP